MNKNSNLKNDPTILVVANTLQQLATRSPLSKKQNRELFNDLCNFYPQTGLQNVLKPCLFNAIDSGHRGNLEFILKK